MAIKCPRFFNRLGLSEISEKLPTKDIQIFGKEETLTFSQVPATFSDLAIIPVTSFPG